MNERMNSHGVIRLDNGVPRELAHAQPHEFFTGKDCVRFWITLLVSMLFVPALSAEVFDSPLLLADVDRAASQVFVGNDATAITNP